VEVRFAFWLNGLGPGALDELEAGTPTEDEQRQHDAGNNDEGQLYAGAREHSKGHSSDDGA
jgi:hypothetical protein